VNYPALIISIILVICAVIAYVTREVGKSFDQYFDEIEGKD